MRSKATFFAGFATGYVLGFRAGRARYEQIRQAAKSFAREPSRSVDCEQPPAPGRRGADRSQGQGR